MKKSRRWKSTDAAALDNAWVESMLFSARSVKLFSAGLAGASVVLCRHSPCQPWEHAIAHLRMQQLQSHLPTARAAESGRKRWRDGAGQENNVEIQGAFNHL